MSLTTRKAIPYVREIIIVNWTKPFWIDVLIIPK